VLVPRTRCTRSPGIFPRKKPAGEKLFWGGALTKGGCLHPHRVVCRLWGVRLRERELHTPHSLLNHQCFFSRNTLEKKGVKHPGGKNCGIPPLLNTNFSPVIPKTLSLLKGFAPFWCKKSLKPPLLVKIQIPHPREILVWASEFVDWGEHPKLTPLKGPIPKAHEKVCKLPKWEPFDRTPWKRVNSN